MTHRKASCSVLFLSAALLGCSTILSSIRYRGGSLYSDGGAPEPPVPPGATPNSMVPALIADGGAPEPPVPPGPKPNITA